MLDAVRNLHALGVPLPAALHAASAVPARVLGLRVGRPADGRRRGRRRDPRRQPRARAGPGRRRGAVSSPEPARDLDAGLAAPRRDPRAAARAPPPRRARRRRTSASPRPPATGATGSSGWSRTARPTTLRRSASTRSGCCRAGPRCGTRSRSPSTTTRRWMSGSARDRALAVGPDARRRGVPRARARAGAFTVAVTNEPESELAQAAEALLPLAAGPELAVAATKTYLTQIGALALLAAYVGGEGKRYATAILHAADVLEECLPRLERRCSRSRCRSRSSAGCS